MICKLRFLGTTRKLARGQMGGGPFTYENVTGFERIAQELDGSLQQCGWRQETMAEEVKEAKGERLWSVRGKLQVMARGLRELGDDLDQARAEDRLSLVCELKQEVGLVAQSLEEAHAQLLSPAFDAGEKEKGRRWLSWGITSSLILLSLVSLGSAIVSCLQPHCCSDPSNSWAILSNPVTFSYVNGPPPI